MYNQEIKNKYLSKINDIKEITNVLTLFQTSSILEERYGKDLSYFNKDEMIELLKMFKIPSVNGTRELQRRINRYFVYYSENYDNKVKKLQIGEEKIREIANSGKTKLVSIGKKEFEMLIEKLLEDNNAQCAFSLIAAWSGLKGTFLSEITLAKMGNIDKNNKKLKVYSYNEKKNEILFDREIFVSDLFIKVADLADKEMIYVDGDNRILGTYEPSDYIIKVRVTNQNADKDFGLIETMKNKYRMVFYRMNRLLSKDVSFPNLNFESIRRSGIAADTIEVANLFGVPIDKLEEESNRFVLKLILDKYKIDMTYMRSIISTHILKI